MTPDPETLRQQTRAELAEKERAQLRMDVGRLEAEVVRLTAELATTQGNLNLTDLAREQRTEICQRLIREKTDLQADNEKLRAERCPSPRYCAGLPTQATRGDHV